MWDYIKKNELQDPKNKRRIVFDDKLQVLFKQKATDMFKLPRLLGRLVKTSDDIIQENEIVSRVFVFFVERNL